MANRPSVPKFGTWDSDNARYTVYFEKIRENKGATAPPLHRPFNPNEDPPEEEDPAAPRLIVTPAGSSSRPATSSGQRAAHHQQQPAHAHRRAGSSSSVPSDHGGGGRHHQSKFAPPPQYQPRPQAPAPGAHGHQPAAHGGDHGHHHRPTGHHAQHSSRQQQQQSSGSRARSASPRHSAQGRQRPTAVPRFGVWDEQSAAAQGFTVQFDNVKRHREVARGRGVPDVPRRRMPSPESYAAARRRSSSRQHTPFVSKMFGCFLQHPTTRD
ncbi:uncharacterized protein LOC100839873 isoform X1 [Brachypodium distachyon]|uniref:uncharacterized protein LOC100839873 isoform X1 n=1 Tax=Brachypodium distachyon TaxID=15368 RepID=UPI000D0CEF8E|nr:uncharacterized protein LOC100839873 isoform X1 [Brachypodium distachyon]|eukprot:XP_024317141.1 uncharacterized protein LOC100839873 isoform X1 [Brachypodium distachyon]